MGAIGFYIFYSINWVITLLPLRVLYLFSNFLFVLFYYFPGYRKKVVSENLSKAFPEKSQEERSAICRGFYRHFCDLIVEILKLTHMSNKQLSRRMVCKNPEVIGRLYKEGRDAVVIFSHYCNWEWMKIVPHYTEHLTVPVYKPLNNKYFDKFMYSLRAGNNCYPIAMSNILREILKNLRENRRTLYGLISDQTPAKAEIRYRTTFLNQDTPVFLGAEKIAVKYNMPVVYMNTQKVRKGYYSFSFDILFENPNGLPEYQITETHVKKLEEIIRAKPEYWLWTHRRWKY
ncbi:MAG TPA: lysophospholipid acyltransferase family protein [Bacteroidales bacterium]|nr:lysophospholipid acyltransferase family protein [Bacteroidales bacterium]